MSHPARYSRGETLRATATATATAILLLSVLLLPAATAAEPVGNDFQGTASRDGADAPTGLQVRAEVDGVVYGSGDTFNIGAGTRYFMSTEGEDTATPPKDGIVNGELMVFWVGGSVANEVHTDWREGQVTFGIPVPTLTDLDLHYDSAGQPVPVKINELLAVPASGEEWVELFNPSPVDTANLSAYRLEDNDGWTLSLTGTLGPGQHLQVSLGGTPVLDDSGMDEIKVAWRDPGGVKAAGNWVVVDRVEYGPNGAGPDDTAPTNADMNNAALPSPGASQELVPDGDDSQHPGNDFTLSSRPTSTPGYRNTAVQPLLGVLSPNGGAADWSVSISWDDDDPDDNANITLSYDTDAVPGGEALIGWAPYGEDSDGLGDFYLWNTSLVPEGFYYVKAVITDGLTPQTTSVSPAVVEIQHPPTLWFTEPDGVADTADSLYTVRWYDWDSNDNASLTLYYDTDPSPGGEALLGTVPQGEDPEGPWDTLVWDVTALAEGGYYVKGVIDDGQWQATAWSPGPLFVTHPPSVVVDRPMAGDEADATFDVAFTPRDADGSAAVSLYHDSDASGLDGTLIASGLPEDPGAQTYSWDTSALPEGSTWYVYATITDGTTTASDYSEAPLTIRHPPAIEVTEPDGVGDVADTSFLITWTDRDTDDDASIRLYFDADPLPGGEVEITATPLSEDADGPSGSSLWDTSFAVPGLFYVKAVIVDGSTSSYDYSVAPLLIRHNAAPVIAVLAPSSDTFADTAFTVSWFDFDPDDNASISLYRDGDLVPGGEVKIADMSQGEDSYVDSYVWDLTAVANGSYYVKAVIADGKASAFDYSSGRVVVLHQSGGGENAPPEITNPVPSDSATAGSLYVRNFDATDPDGDALSWVLLDSPAWLGVDSVSGLVSGTPPSAGNYTVTVVVNDGRGGSDSAVYVIAATSGGGGLLPLVVTVTLDPIAAVSGEAVGVSVLVESSGSAVAGATVSLSANGGVFSSDSGTTDASGRFSSTLVTPAVTANTTMNVVGISTKAGYESASGSAPLQVAAPSSGGLPRLSVSVTPSPATVAPGEALNVLVHVEHDGQPVAGAAVSLGSSGGSLSASSGTTDAAGNLVATLTAPAGGNGSFTITAVATKGGYTAGADSAGFAVRVGPPRSTANQEAWPWWLLVVILLVVLVIILYAMYRQQRQALAEEREARRSTETPPDPPPEFPPPPPP